MPAHKRISQRQLEILLAFAEANRDISLGLCSRGSQGNQSAQLAWKTLALKLNAVGDGITKTGDEWRRYWVEWKLKTKTKGADSRRSAKKTGGGPNKLAPLSEFEERVLQLIGPVAVGGLPGVRMPFTVPSDQHTSSATLDQSDVASSSSFSQPSTSRLTSQSSAVMEVEWLEDDVFEPLLPELQTDVPPPYPSSLPTTSIPPPQPLPAPQPMPTSPRPLPSPTEQPAQPPQRHTQQRSGRTRDVPQWALDLEERRIAVEDRHASAIVSLERKLAGIENSLNGINNSLQQIVNKLGNK